MDEDILRHLKANHELVVTLEDGIISGGFGSRIAQFYGPSIMKTLCCRFGRDIPTKFTVDEMLEKNELKPIQVVDRILQILKYKETEGGRAKMRKTPHDDINANPVK